MTRGSLVALVFSLVVSLLAALLLTLLIAQVGLQLVRQFHERPVHVYVCETDAVPDCRQEMTP